MVRGFVWTPPAKPVIPFALARDFPLRRDPGGERCEGRPALGNGGRVACAQDGRRAAQAAGLLAGCRRPWQVVAPPGSRSIAARWCGGAAVEWMALPVVPLVPVVPLAGVVCRGGAGGGCRAAVRLAGGWHFRGDGAAVVRFRTPNGARLDTETPAGTGRNGRGVVSAWAKAGGVFAGWRFPWRSFGPPSLRACHSRRVPLAAGEVLTSERRTVPEGPCNLLRIG